MVLPFVTQRATHADIKDLIKILPPPRKPNKDGLMYLPGDEFAKGIADFLGSRYVNNKAPFDIICDVGNVDVGVEVKKQHFEPKNHLYAEFLNGTATVWAYIEALTGINREQLTAVVKTNVLAQKLGDAFCDFCWNRWQIYADKQKSKPLSVDRSVFVIGQLFDNHKKQQVCKVFTFPLSNFPRRGALSWAFNGSGKALRGMVGDHVMIEWYWKDNGQSKIFPLIDQCLFESPTFRTHIDDYERISRLIEADPCFEKIDHAICKTDSPETIHRLLRLVFEKSGLGFTNHYGDVLKRLSECEKELHQLRRAVKCHL